MIIGNGWSNTTRDGRACIDLQFDGVFTRVFPWLKDLRFRMTYISQENRADEKSPDWALQSYPKQESDSKTSSKVEELVKNNNPATQPEDANARIAEAEWQDRAGV